MERMEISYAKNEIITLSRALPSVFCCSAASKPAHSRSPGVAQWARHEAKGIEVAISAKQTPCLNARCAIGEGVSGKRATFPVPPFRHISVGLTHFCFRLHRPTDRVDLMVARQTFPLMVQTHANAFCDETDAGPYLQYIHSHLHIADLCLRRVNDRKQAGNRASSTKFAFEKRN